MNEPLTGGCQCGAVRFRVEGPPGRVSICHCRMCQKAFAAPYGAFVSVELGKLSWTRGEPRRFNSSADVLRGFCAECGTPLTFEPAQGGDAIGIAACAFDAPQHLVPQRQIWTESRLEWADDLSRIPARPAEQDAAARARYGDAPSLQHPDHDTDSWPRTR